MLVQAALGHHPVGIVHVVAAAEEKLDVALQGVIVASIKTGKYQGHIPSRSYVGISNCRAENTNNLQQRIKPMPRSNIARCSYPVMVIR